MTQGTNKFSLEWNLNLIFDRDVTEMRAASFKVVDVQIHPEMEPTRAASIRRVLLEDIRDAASDDGELQDLRM